MARAARTGEQRRHLAFGYGSSASPSVHSFIIIHTGADGQRDFGHIPVQCIYAVAHRQIEVLNPHIAFGHFNWSTGSFALIISNLFIIIILVVLPPCPDDGRRDVAQRRFMDRGIICNADSINHFGSALLISTENHRNPQ